MSLNFSAQSNVTARLMQVGLKVSPFRMDINYTLGSLRSLGWIKKTDRVPPWRTWTIEHIVVDQGVEMIDVALIGLIYLMTIKTLLIDWLIDKLAE